MLRYAQKQDLSWLDKQDSHINTTTIQTKIDHKEIIVIIEKGNIIGFLRFGYLWDCIPFMNLLWILKDYRRQGFGTKLVLFWEKQMEQAGYKQVMTSTLSNENAQFFYRKLGYSDCGSLLLQNEPLEIIFHKYLKT